MGFMSPVYHHSSKLSWVYSVHFHRSNGAMRPHVVCLGDAINSLCPHLDQGCTLAVRSGSAHRRCLPPASCPNGACECPCAVAVTDGAAGGLWRADRPQHHPCL